MSSITMQTTNGRACVTNCIDQGKFFCASADFQDGVCCEDADDLCRLDTSGLCSFDIPVELYPQSLYLACPFDENICGESRTVQVLANETSVSITSLENKNSNEFSFAQLCAYEVKWPQEATDGDELIFTATYLAEGAQVFVASAKKELTSSETTGGIETKLDVMDEVLRYKYPMNIFVTVKASDLGLDSAFRVNVSFLPQYIEEEYNTGQDEDIDD